MTRSIDTQRSSAGARQHPGRDSLRRAVLFVCLFVAGGMNGSNCEDAPMPCTGGGGGTAGGPEVLADDHVLGDADAPVTVFEYGDFQCPFCGAWARSEFPTFAQDYIDTGKVRYVFRHFPLRSIHPRAESAARASECADDQGAFFPYHDEIYADQNDLSDENLGNHADALGLDRTQFDACFPGPTKESRVQRDVNSGMALGVTGTPTFFVNGEAVAGFRTAEQLGEVVDRKLNELNECP